MADNFIERAAKKGHLGTMAKKAAQDRTAIWSSPKEDEEHKAANDSIEENRKRLRKIPESQGGIGQTGK